MYNKKAIVLLTRGYNILEKYNELIKRNIAIENNLNDKSIDILIFHENNITFQQQKYIKSKTNSLNIIFISIIEKGFLKEKENIEIYEKTKLFKIGYRHMCSFWFVNFWDYVKDYDLILRIDEDCIINFNIDNLLYELNNKVCIYGDWVDDCDYVTFGLNNFTMNFFNTRNTHNPSGPYTNIIAFNLNILRENNLLKKYINEINNKNYIYKYRWGDLPLWGEVLTYLYTEKDHVCSSKIKYYHGSHNVYINKSMDNFDWIKYINYYNILNINTKEDAINHYLNIGKNENKIYFTDILYTNFDWIAYKNFYPDLKDIINIKDDAIKHYENFGKKENRFFFELYEYDNFNWNEYINYYKDLNYIIHKDEAYKHFIEYGIFEKRIFFENNNLKDFYWELYINYYDDLKKSNISTKKEALKHWKEYGYIENRIYFKYESYENFYWEKYLLYYNLEKIYFTKEEAIVDLLNNNRLFFYIYNLDKMFPEKDIVDNFKKINKVFINIKAYEYTPIIIKYILNYIRDYIIVKSCYDANIIISHICDDNYYFIDNTFKILISGEPYDNLEDFNLFITTIIIDNIPNNKKYIYYPYLYYSLNEHKYSINQSDYFNTKKKFCAYMYSREFEHRIKYFNLISQYKKVDALGRCCNNINIENTRSVYNDNITYNDIAVKIYCDYKFVLAIENTFAKGYFTEKLINPIIANSIPIYWGHDYVFNYINKKRVIYINDFENDEDLLEYIKNIDNNEDEYNKIINENIYIKYNDEIIENLNENIKKSLISFRL